MRSTYYKCEPQVVIDLRIDGPILMEYNRCLEESRGESVRCTSIKFSPKNKSTPPSVRVSLPRGGRPTESVKFGIPGNQSYSRKWGNQTKMEFDGFPEVRKLGGGLPRLVSAAECSSSGWRTSDLW